VEDVVLSVKNKKPTLKGSETTHPNPLQPQVIAPHQRAPFWPHVLELVFVFNPIPFIQVT
jgi:hypothetical protein